MNDETSCSVERNEVSPQECFFLHGGVRYGYLMWGDAGCENHAATPIVLLHGFAQGAESWNEVAPLLVRARCVYALDWVGHGRSDRPSDVGPYALEAQVDALIAFLAYVASESTTPLVAGYSMGGRIALVAAARSPHLFAALVLEAAGLGAVADEDRSSAADRDTLNAARLRSEGVEVFMHVWEQLPLFATQQSLPDEVRKRVCAERLANDAEALARTFEGAGQHAMPLRADMLADVAVLAIPVLYLVGSLDVKYRTLAEELAALPQVMIEVIEGVGHNVHLEAADVYVSVIEAFANHRLFS